MVQPSLLLHFQNILGPRPLSPLLPLLMPQICEGIPVQRSRKTISIEEVYPSWSSTGGPRGQQEPALPPGTEEPPSPQHIGSGHPSDTSLRVGLVAGLSSAAVIAVLLWLWLWCSGGGCVAVAVVLRRTLFKRAAPSDLSALSVADELGIFKDLEMVEANLASQSIPSLGVSVSRSLSVESRGGSLSIQRSYESLSKISTLSKVRMAATSPLMPIDICY